MALLDTLVGELGGPKSVETLSKSTGADAGQVQQVITAALPVLLSSMHKNASTEKGAQALSAALEKHAPNASDSTNDMLQKADAADGDKILTHVLGDNKADVTKKIATTTGLSAEQVSGIMATLAPVVMSLMGSHKQEQKTQSSPSDLMGMLAGAVLGGHPSNHSGVDLGGIVSSLLGGEGAGDLLGGLLGGNAKGGKKDGESPLSGILSGLLGGGGTSKKEGAADAIGGLLSNLLK